MSKKQCSRWCSAGWLYPAGPLRQRQFLFFLKDCSAIRCAPYAHAPSGFRSTVAHSEQCCIVPYLLLLSLSVVHTYAHHHAPCSYRVTIHEAHLEVIQDAALSKKLYRGATPSPFIAVSLEGTTLHTEAKTATFNPVYNTTCQVRIGWLKGRFQCGRSALWGDYRFQYCKVVEHSQTCTQ